MGRALHRPTRESTGIRPNPSQRSLHDGRPSRGLPCQSDFARVGFFRVGQMQSQGILWREIFQPIRPFDEADGAFESVEKTQLDDLIRVRKTVKIRMPT